MFYSDNPAADFQRWDSEQERKLRRLPTCYHCGEPIQDDHCFRINGVLYCSDCMNDLFRRDTEDYIEER